MGLVKVQLVPEFISGFLIETDSTDVIKLNHGLPKDSKLVRMYYDPNYDLLNFIFESDEFPGNVKGALIPFFNPVFSKKTDPYLAGIKFQKSKFKEFVKKIREIGPCASQGIYIEKIELLAKKELSW